MGAYGRIVMSHLDALAVPESLIHQGDYTERERCWPPRPGCGKCPDLGVGRMWARIDLAEWIEQAPHAFGPHRDGELEGLAAVGAELRDAGEGAQVLWAIDVIAAEQWVDPVDSPALAVAELVCLGPHIPDTLIDNVDQAIAAFGWTYLSNVDANQPCTVNRTPCFHTAWHDGLALSENATATPQIDHRRYA